MTMISTSLVFHPHTENRPEQHLDAFRTRRSFEQNRTDGSRIVRAISTTFDTVHA